VFGWNKNVFNVFDKTDLKTFLDQHLNCQLATDALVVFN